MLWLIKNKKKKSYFDFHFQFLRFKKCPLNTTLKGEKWENEIWKQSIPVENRQNCDRKGVAEEYNPWYSWRCRPILTSLKNVHVWKKWSTLFWCRMFSNVAAYVKQCACCQKQRSLLTSTLKWVSQCSSFSKCIKVNSCWPMFYSGGWWWL